jgi:alkylhydroperoxidase family enzyme
MTSSRLAPLAPPYDPELAALLERLRLGLPEPLALFRTLAHAPRVLSRVASGGLLDRGPVPLRLRELVILRTTARLGAEYEWGVHVAGFAAKAQLSEDEIRATFLDAPGAARGGTGHPWQGDDALVLALADTLIDTATLDDALYAELSSHFAPDALLELVALVGFYHLISFQVRALRLQGEPFAPPFPRSE